MPLRATGHARAPFISIAEHLRCQVIGDLRQVYLMRRHEDGASACKITPLEHNSISGVAYLLRKARNIPKRPAVPLCLSIADGAFSGRANGRADVGYPPRPTIMMAIAALEVPLYRHRLGPRS